MQNDSAMPDDRKLEYIRDHRMGVKRLCGLVARERRLTGDQTTEALLDVARTTVHRLRVTAVAYGENLFHLFGTDPGDEQLQRECLDSVRADPDCAVLWQLEEALRVRLKQPPGWSKKLFSLAEGGLKVVQQGGAFVLQTLKNVVVRIFHSVWDLICFLMPYILRIVGWLFASPRTAMFAFLMAKSMQRIICRRLTETYTSMVHTVPEGFFDQSLVAMVANQARYAAEYGQNLAFTTVLQKAGGAIATVILESGSQFVNYGVDMSLRLIGGAAVAGGMVGALVGVGAVATAPVSMTTAVSGAVIIGIGAMLKSCIEVTTEMTKDAIEYAAYANDFENAFTHLFDIMSFQECFKEWRKAIVRISDMDQYQANRGIFQKKGIKEYTQERKEQLKKKGVEDAVITDIIRDEVRLYTQNQSMPVDGKAALSSHRARRQRAAKQPRKC